MHAIPIGVNNCPRETSSRSDNDLYICHLPDHRCSSRTGSNCDPCLSFSVERRQLPPSSCSKHAPGILCTAFHSDGCRSCFERYWQPINSLGYRDYEWTPEKVGNRKRIVVVGDSFVAGGGVEKIEDRFSNQLGEKLGDDYVVMTVARNGWNTRQEIEGVLAYP